MNGNIGNFAESLILDELASPAKKPHSPEKNSNWGDISDVEVGASFRDQLIESATSSDPNSVDIPIPEEPPVSLAQAPEPELVDPEGEDLVDRLETLLTEFKVVLSEMTSAGMLGVNLSTPEKPKDKKKKPRTTDKAKNFKEKLRFVIRK
tara:strand:+ start:138 stop:587 length:450 start_codon:yes stop_codon:yes gene_type:complete